MSSGIVVVNWQALLSGYEIFNTDFLKAEYELTFTTSLLIQRMTYWW